MFNNRPSHLYRRRNQMDRVRWARAAVDDHAGLCYWGHFVLFFVVLGFELYEWITDPYNV